MNEITKTAKIKVICNQCNSCMLESAEIKKAELNEILYNWETLRSTAVSHCPPCPNCHLLAFTNGIRNFTIKVINLEPALKADSKTNQ
jgi:hypothetical protein